MENPRARVLVTGIAGNLAGRLAARLEADDRVRSITGIDLRRPRHQLKRTDLVRADLRSPLIARVIESAGIDTIVHLSTGAAVGSLQLFGAARKAPRLRKVVARSTTAVYGGSSAAPAFWREDATPGDARPPGYSKDAVEVEGYARAFGRRRTEVTLTILRFADIAGAGVDTPLARYLSLPVVPTVLGYDPRLQLCHQDDAVEVLVRATLEEHPGVYNVAGPGILYLSQAIRRVGKMPVPVPLPLVNGLERVLRHVGVPALPANLLYGCVGDITSLRERFGYEPKFSTGAALDGWRAAR